MEQTLRIMLIAIGIIFIILVFIWIINKIVDKVMARRNPYETYFASTVVKSDTTDYYILIIKGCEQLYEGDYHIVFRLADGAKITLCDTEINFSNSWFVKYFTRTERGHGFVISECPIGKHLLIVEIMNEHMRQTLYIPFEIQPPQKEDLQCRES